MENSVSAPADREILELPGALAKMQATGALLPMLQWMVDNSTKSADAVLREVSEVTGVSVRTKEELMAALRSMCRD